MNETQEIVYNLDKKPFPSFEMAAKMRDLLMNESPYHYQVQLLQEGNEDAGFVVKRKSGRQEEADSHQEMNIESLFRSEQNKTGLTAKKVRKQVYRPALRVYYLYIPLVILACILTFFAVDLWIIILSFAGFKELPPWVNGDLLITITQWVGVIWMVKLFLNVLFTYYGTALLIGKNGITYKRGILTRDVTNVRFSEIKTIGLRQGIFDRILNIGILEFASSGTDDVDIRFINIANPAGVKADIEDIIEQFQR